MTTKADSGRSYHRRATGTALTTVQAHESEAPITLFASCFCPFVQRTWVALEYLGIDYKYYEVDPYEKPKELLEVSPKGLVPGLRLNGDPPRALNESTVIAEYLEDVAITSTKRSLLPPTSAPYARALVRLQADHVNRTLVPAFYRFLQAQKEEDQVEGSKAFYAALGDLAKLFERAEREAEPHARRHLGLWVDGADLGWTDVLVGPWIFRATHVLSHYRGFRLPKGARFAQWVARLLAHPAFAATCSDEQLYLDSYERYAFNRPNTSMVANAINSGQGLP